MAELTPAEIYALCAFLRGMDAHGGGEHGAHLAGLEATEDAPTE